MDPIGKITLAKNGNDDDRVGPNVRTVVDRLKEMEEILHEEVKANTQLSLTCDVRPESPPLFNEFVYVDVLGGIMLKTLSAEINARVAKRALETTSASAPFPLESTFDKYVDMKPPSVDAKRVIFLAGSNATCMIDQGKLQALMQDPDTYIKPHPVTNDTMLREMGIVYGYGRILPKNESGLEYLQNAQEVGAMETSELFIQARLMGKKVHNMSRFDNAHIATYHHVLRNLDGTPEDINRINTLLMGPLSGYIRPEYSDDKCRGIIKAYVQAALEERSKFEMLTNVNLSVSAKTIRAWTLPQ